MKRFTFEAAGRMALLCICLQAGAAGAAISADQARRIHDRIAGVPPAAAVLADMMNAADAQAAAQIAMNNPAFYNARLKNWITPWTNRDDDAFAPLNDFTATVIGLIRDGGDFRQVLYGDVIYVGAAQGYSNTGNAPYEALERSNANLGDPAVLAARTQSAVTGLPAAATAGVMTTRAAARAFFIDGTNRAMFRFTLKNMLCRDLEAVHDTTRPADRIRQDVTRSPGNDSRIFLNNCVGCHNGMDPLAQAFAYYDFSYDRTAADTDAAKAAGALVYSAGVVTRKYHHDAGNFKPGFHTPDDQWTNNWRLGPNAAIFGWAGVAGADGLVHGSGAKSMGQELASSQAFAECQVKKVFRLICLREPGAADRSAARNGVNGFDAMLGSFNATHNLKTTFAQAAAYCAGN